MAVVLLLELQLKRADTTRSVVESYNSLQVADFPSLL